MARPNVSARLHDLERQRAQVLSHPLARGIAPDEVHRFLATLPDQRFPSLCYAARGATPLIQPRGGVPLFEDQLALTQALSSAGADFIPLTIDSYTRHNQYDTATQLLKRSEEEGRSYLNGYPLVSHGHELTRQLYVGLDKPVSLRHGTPDARLLVEVAIASGIVEIEGGGLCYCLPYSEGFPLDRCLLYWQYVDRVCALYSTPQRPVHRESFGPLSATLVPPAIAMAIEIIEALLAAEQGVASFAVSFGQTGSFIQDVATARVLRKLARHYLDEFGFGSMRLSLVYHQWMGQFPAQRERAAALIAGSALIAGVIDADKIVVKTVDEALGIPRPSVNAEAVDTVRYVLRTFSAAGAIDSPTIELEAALLESEVRSILGAIFALSGDVFWESVYRAFQLGYLDVPFSPHADNANKLVSMRDGNHSIRISDAGQVPISAADAATERRLLEARADRSDLTYRQMLADISLMV
ncbi:MAG: methylaspartate mutase subunit E [Rhodoferax sp.]|nr:methylaspartate mutase subunit E [Rhodoferax sp.]